MELRIIQEALRASPEELLGVYLFGSHAYGALRPDSDKDLLVILADSTRRRRDMRWLIEDGWVPPGDWKSARRAFVGRKRFQIWAFEEETFLRMLSAQVPLALEALFLPPPLVLQSWTAPAIVINRRRLWESYSYVSAAHWQKGLARFLVEGATVYEAKKLLLHSLRVLLFGAQLAKYQKIIDYSAANPLREEILSYPETSPEAHQAAFLPTWSALRAELERLCTTE